MFSVWVVAAGLVTLREDRNDHLTTKGSLKKSRAFFFPISVVYVFQIQIRRNDCGLA